MRPGNLWLQMQQGEQIVMRSSLNLGEDTTLLCLKGGPCGEGELALRLPVEVDVHRLLDTWAGLLVTTTVGGAFPGQQVVRIAPADAGYRDLYIHLADDLHDHLERTTSADAAVRILLTRLRLWSSFLQRNTRLPDSRTIRGIFAELCALEQFLVPAVGWGAALGIWTGPSGSPQDVMTDQLVLDVKATQMQDNLVTISSIEQLDPPGTRAVRLLQARLSEGSGESLQTLVDRLRTFAEAAGVGSMFAARLVQVGMTSHALVTLPEQPMYVEGWVLHEADHPDFPALRRHALPNGVVSASYRIDLSRSAVAPADLSSLPLLLKPSHPGESP